MEKICLECNDRFQGRIDKKFCCDQCRNNYNNKLHSYSNNYTRKVNYILKKNRKILSSFAPAGKAKVNKEVLRRKGFEFGYLTNIYTTKSGNRYHFCYEYGYLDIGEGWYSVVLKEEYVGN